MKLSFSGHCDWCGNYTENLVEHKDFEEGAAGQYYDVCEECRREENRKIDAEAS